VAIMQILLPIWPKKHSRLEQKATAAFTAYKIVQAVASQHYAVRA